MFSLKDTVPALALSVSLAFAGCGVGSSLALANEASPQDAAIEAPADELASPEQEAAALIEGLQGTYTPLFDTIFEEQYDAIWTDYSAAVMGEENAEMTADYLKFAIGGEAYGQEGIEANEELANDGMMQFACGFINGAAKISFDGNSIVVYDGNGDVISNHEYEFTGMLTIGDDPEMSMDTYLFETSDADAGEFTYFAMCPDTPGTTYHIEFRYGSDAEALTGYFSGPYAYWLAAGITEDADQDMIDNVIGLFVTENVAGSAAATEETLAQAADLVGTWDCDMSAFEGIEGYEGMAIRMKLADDGTGATYISFDGGETYMQSEDGDYQFFAYDNDGDDTTQSGVYVVYDAAEGSYSHYAIADVDGQTVLTFSGYEGSYPFELAYTKVA